MQVKETTNADTVSSAANVRQARVTADLAVVGCGNGPGRIGDIGGLLIPDIAGVTAAGGWSVLTSSPDPETLRSATDAGVRFVSPANAWNLLYPKGFLKAAVLRLAPEQHKVGATLDELVRVVRSGGRIVIATAVPLREKSRLLKQLNRHGLTANVVLADVGNGVIGEGNDDDPLVVIGRTA